MKTEFIALNAVRPAGRHIYRAARVLRAGGVIIFPTETVYGLGGDGSRPEVVGRIYAIKGRPIRKPLVRLIASWEELEGIRWRPEHLSLAKRFWPGPITLILKLRSGIRQGFRFPDHLFVRRLIEMSGVSLVATSANLSGEEVVVSGKDARRLFSGKVDLIVDGGEVSKTPSTVLDLSVFPEKILRPGPIAKEQIENCLGHILY